MKNRYPFILLSCLIIFLGSNRVDAQAKNFSNIDGRYKSILDMMRELPGVDVRSTNEKNGGSVTIRGLGSLNNQRQPLYVVDGVVYTGDITGINTQDVDMISVIKDAASTSVYGAQGAFGVISIVTKSGKGGINRAIVSNHNESAYTYFIEHKTPLKIIGLEDQIIIEGVIQEQRDSVLVFVKKKKETLVPIKNIKRVEMIHD